MMTGDDTAKHIAPMELWTWRAIEAINMPRLPALSAASRRNVNSKNQQKQLRRSAMLIAKINNQDQLRRSDMLIDGNWK
jgi:hypothetical protein